MTGKYKSTVVIWSEFDPNYTELQDLAYEATSGAAICTDHQVIYYEDPAAEDEDYANTGDFFCEEEEDELEVAPLIEPNLWTINHPSLSALYNTTATSSGWITYSSSVVSSTGGWIFPSQYTEPVLHSNCINCGGLIYINDIDDLTVTYLHADTTACECDTTDPFGDYALPAV